MLKLEAAMFPRPSLRSPLHSLRSWETQLRGPCKDTTSGRRLNSSPAHTQTTITPSSLRRSLSERLPWTSTREETERGRYYTFGDEQQVFSHPLTLFHKLFGWPLMVTATAWLYVQPYLFQIHVWILTPTLKHRVHRRRLELSNRREP